MAHSLPARTCLAPGCDIEFIPRTSRHLYHSVACERRTRRWRKRALEAPPTIQRAPVADVRTLAEQVRHELIAAALNSRDEHLINLAALTAACDRRLAREQAAR